MAGLRDPEIPDGESIEYEGLIGDERVGEGRHLVEAVDVDGIPHYRHSIEISVKERANSSVATMFSRRRGKLLAESYRAEARDGEKLVAVEEAYFRDVKVLQFGGELEPYPRDLTPLLGCAVAMRGVDLSPDAKDSVTVWLANTAHWEVTTKVEESEEITVPAGTFKALRLRVFPDLQPVARNLHTLVEHLMPPVHLHLDAEPPHRVVRFSFPTGPFPWNPRGVIQATAIEAGG